MLVAVLQFFTLYNRGSILYCQVNDDVNQNELEANWKAWSGCDVIHEQLKGDSRLVESHLYKVGCLCNNKLSKQCIWMCRKSSEVC